MKRWALLTLLLYLLCLSGLAMPTLLLVADEGEDLVAAFYVGIVPLMLIVQAVLLAVPVAVVQGRQVARRTVRSAAILAALPMGILLAAFVWFSALLVLGEKGLGDDDVLGWGLLGLLVAGWIFWGVLFARFHIEGDARAFNRGIARWHLGGSILEMLVAIPSHIVARQRHDCCAPGITLLGLATGISVALLAFGPGLFYLFAGNLASKRSQVPEPR